MSGRSGLAYVCLAATLLTATMAVPVLRAPGERMFGTEIVGRHHDPYTVMRQFAGAPVPSPYLQPATDWLGRALAGIMSPVAAFNIVILWTFPLTAAFTYLLAYEVTRSIPASVLAGLLGAFAPFHVAHAAYHPHIAQVQWIPLYFLALWRCLHGITARRAATLAVSLSLVVLSNFYGGFIALTMTVAALPLFWLAPDPEGRTPAGRDFAWTSVVLIAICAAALAVAYAIVPGVLEQRDTFAATPRDLFTYHARWWAYLVPPVEHAALGSWSGRVWDSYGIRHALLEQQVYVGFGVLTLAAVALWRWARARDRRELLAIPLLAAIALTALICSLSPEGQLFGIRIVRPSALLYLVAPMFRSYARFGVVVQLMLAILAGVGLTCLWQRRRSTRQTGLARAAAVALVGLAAFEYAPLPWRSRDVLPTSAHRWLAREGATPRVFECAGSTLSEHSTAWLAGYPIGYLREALPDCGEPDLAWTLRQAGFTHLLVRAPLSRFSWLVDHWPQGLRRSYGADDGAVFEVIVTRPVAFVSSLEGLFPREYDHAWTWRWTSGTAALHIDHDGDGPQASTLDIELAAFGVERQVIVSLNGRRVTDVFVGSERAWYPIGPMLLRPGGNELTIQSVEPPIVAGLLEHNDDPRPLALALGAWRWHWH